ncbi:MAG TPA: adenylate/guanylate cyclase domain-containing protein [Candidatus Limnocylindria bacterium]|nr:adenylate/guanylate cyclase domain-containing protein [Candidatus Limnocylindria bacterium]
MSEGDVSPRTDPDVPRSLEHENRTLERKLRRLEANVRQMEGFQDSNSKLLSKLVRDLEDERARSRQLLLNVLPDRIVQRLEAGESRIADRHDSATVLFSDFVDFTRIAATLEPQALIDELNELFSGFDAISERNGVEKIKTIGDAYLVVGGLSETSTDDAAAVAETALGMCAFVAGREGALADWRIRIGIHSGPLYAGIVGTTRFAYDVWGDTVNTASRLETTSEGGRIHVSSELAARLEDRYALERRGPIQLKGLGLIETCFLVGRR